MGAQASKRWSVNAVSEGQGPLTYYCDGRPLTQSAPGTLDNVSPVEHLLIGVAGCFALSCRAAISKRGLSRVSFEVIATGEKNLSAGNLLSGIAVVAIFRSGITDAQAAAIADDAKPMCTVTNTLRVSPEIVYSSRTLREPRLAQLGTVSA